MKVEEYIEQVKNGRPVQEAVFEMLDEQLRAWAVKKAAQLSRENEPKIGKKVEPDVGTRAKNIIQRRRQRAENPPISTK